MQLQGTQFRFWRWRYHALLGSVLLIFIVSRLYSIPIPSRYPGHFSRLSSNSIASRYPGQTTYVENGVELSSFAAPFKCDINTLPSQVRIVRRTQENYAIAIHGTPDIISDAHWNGIGDIGWEEDLSKQMAAYMAVIQRLEPQRDGFLDLGANIGTHSLYIASRGYNVHAFEPLYANQVLVRCSLALSGLNTMRFNPFGIGDKALRTCIFSPEDNRGGSRIDQNAKNCSESTQIQVGTIDNYYQKFLRGQKVAVAKIDIEGYEVAALRAGTKLFESEDAPVAVFYEFHPQNIKSQGEDPLHLNRYFAERDYVIFELNPGGASDEDLVASDGWGYTEKLAVKTGWVEKLKRAGYRIEGGSLVVTSS